MNAGYRALTTGTDPGKDIAQIYSGYAANLAYESLPAEVVSTLKRVVLDTLGTTLAANTQLVEKFLDCGRHAARSIPSQKLQQAVELVDSLERVPDIAAITRLFAPSL